MIYIATEKLLPMEERAVEPTNVSLSHNMSHVSILVLLGYINLIGNFVFQLNGVLHI